MEYLDYYNSKGKFLGKETRKIVHTKGLWHKTFHCWIIYEDDNGQKIIVMQKRGKEKKSAPHKLDSSVAGHYSAGENIEGGLREFKEETGITIVEKDLIPLGIRISVSDYKPNNINKEFQEVFFVKKKIDLSEYNLPVNEVSGMVELPITKCVDILTGKIKNFKAKGVFTDEDNWTDKLEIKTTVIDKNDFISFIDNFHLKIMLLAEKALNNDKALYI